MAKRFAERLFFVLTPAVGHRHFGAVADRSLHALEFRR